MRSPFGQNWGIPSPFGQEAASGESGILDGYTGTRPIAFLFKAIGSYSGACVRVRRSSDNAETDINFAANGWVDTAAIASHCGASDGFVTVLYDQNAASGINMVQASTSLQPQIYDSVAGMILNEHGNPAMLSTEANRERLVAASSVYSADLLSVLIPLAKDAADSLAVYVHEGAAAWSRFAGAAEDGSASAPYASAGTPLTYVDGTALASNTRNGLHDALEPAAGAADTMLLGVRNLSVFAWPNFAVMGYGSGSYATQATFIGIAMWLDTEIDLADFQAASAAIKTKVSETGSETWTPANLFSGGEEGFFYDMTLSPMYTDAARTTLAGVNDPVYWVDDLSGNGHHLSSGSTGARPTLKESGGIYWLEFDGVSSIMKRTGATFALRGPHAAVAALDRGSVNGNYPLSGIEGIADTNNYARFQGQITNRVLAATRFNANGITFNSTTATAGNMPNSTPSVLTRELALSPGNLSLRVNGGSVSTDTVASNWTVAEVTPANVTIYFGPQSATASTGLKGYFGFYIDRAITSDERDLLEDWARVRAGIAAW